MKINLLNIHEKNKYKQFILSIFHFKLSFSSQLGLLIQKPNEIPFNCNKFRHILNSYFNFVKEMVKLVDYGSDSESDGENSQEMTISKQTPIQSA